MGLLSAATIQKSKSILGIQMNATVDLPKVTNRFLKGDINNEKRIEAKNNIIIHIIEQMNLTTPPEVSIQNQCSACEGRGFNLEFYGVEDIKCPDCIEGWKFCDCRTCSGFGKIGEIPCHTCKGKGVYVYRKIKNVHPGKKCLTCNGTEKTKKIVQRESPIKEIHKCIKCRGTGISTNIGTKVLSEEIVRVLKERSLPMERSHAIN